VQEVGLVRPALVEKLNGENDLRIALVGGPLSLCFGDRLEAEFSASCVTHLGSLGRILPFSVLVELLFRFVTLTFP
jgi:hypothetical protein